MSRRWFWAVPVAALAAGYVVGATTTTYSADYLYYPVSAVDFGEGFALIIPAALAATFLAFRTRWAKVIGTLWLCVVTFLAAAVGLLSWWGGFCLDPGDTCQNTRASRVLMLAGVVAAVSTGFLLFRHLDRREAGPIASTRHRV